MKISLFNWLGKMNVAICIHICYFIFSYFIPSVFSPGRFNTRENNGNVVQVYIRKGEYGGI